MMNVVDTTLGALYISNILFALLFGVATSQLITYFTRYPNDHGLLKVTIAVLWILDMLVLVVALWASYYYTIANYGHLEAMLGLQMKFLGMIAVALTAHINQTVRGVFIYRIWKLSDNNTVVTALASVPSLASYGTISIIALIVMTSKSLPYQGVPSLFSFVCKYCIRGPFASASDGDIVRTLQVAIRLCLSLGATSDIITSMTLCFLLWRNKGQFKGLQSVVRTLMLYTINSSALTSICDIISLATFVTYPSTLVFWPFWFQLSNLFLFSLLFSLNSRRVLRATLGNGKRIPLVSSMERPSLRAFGPQDRTIDIHLETVIDVKNDSISESGTSADAAGSYQ
ncbi:hypothetical protein NLI96_g597 [Meripilus lineatus]|uniref:DUF6534 domain-containing protein n=1 Tax=Meripilus lineatus TaxID=2056292 RepID=A0AAD5VCD8_9APHY|nr:hypothetical protein NLI96_g597 [Physisporinus lineatus]